MKYAIEAEGLVKRYGGKAALDGVDLAVRTGTVLGVLGPNGAGKTTAVRVLATLVVPDAGRAVVGGHDVVRRPARVRELIGLTGQYASVDEQLTGTQNLLLIGRLLGLSRAAARARAAALLARFGLEEAAGRPVGGYSGGMRRRVDLAASLVGDPRVLFLDEPTTGLDPHARGELWEVVKELTASGVTVLLTTQYLEEADQLADDLLVIDRGRVAASGTPAELKALAGGHRLDVRPLHAADLEKAERVLGVRAAGGLLSVPVHDLAVPPALLRRLDDAGVVLAEHALRLPSLDDVFLTLTGEPRTPGEETPAPTGEGRTATGETRILTGEGPTPTGEARILTGEGR
ncbi:ATP-binding cassette domain-containing protein [Nonomuraea fuscirosea]|uniref:ATP-binding cassette domain-containing protein n=1 Tax=Nonomuraea fuscirosea TaxID=1291556 RepID=UPI002DDB58AE|nr:ATP-binding cassette domain-containing protein [Nonomuraea fuscirosea]WSA49571.1 ATP-binding cassette domain-containing protein [Nonomuraea fuscirosea]